MDSLFIEKVRRETPGCKRVIHLNNAGASLMPAIVGAAIKKYIDQEMKMGGYETAEHKADDIQQFYTLTAQLLNARADQIAFTSNATDAFSRALSSIPFDRGDRILTTRHDYISNQLAFLSLKKRFGIAVHYFPVDEDNYPDLTRIEETLDLVKPRLVSVTHIPTNCGTIQPIAEIGAFCRARDILYLVDACQSVGHLQLDVQHIQCDFLSATARKFLRGPRGAGFLYVSERVLEMELEPLFIDMRGADWTGESSYALFSGARRFEDWEFPYALLQGTKEAVRYALDLGMSSIEERILYLADTLRHQCAALPGISVMDRGPHLSGIVSLQVKGRDAQVLKTELRKKRINTSVSRRQAALLDMKLKGADSTLRVSPHVYNTIEEITYFVNTLDGLIHSEF